MGLLDAPLRGLAATVLATFGTSVSIRRVTLATYEVEDGTADDTTADTAVKGVWEDYRENEVGGAVRLGDRKLVLAASDLSYEPATSDKVVVGGEELEIVGVTHWRATDQAALYTLQVRGAA